MVEPLTDQEKDEASTRLREKLFERVLAINAAYSKQLADLRRS